MSDRRPHAGRPGRSNINSISDFFRPRSNNSQGKPPPPPITWPPKSVADAQRLQRLVVPKVVVVPEKHGPGARSDSAMQNRNRIESDKRDMENGRENDIGGGMEKVLEKVPLPVVPSQAQENIDSQNGNNNQDGDTNRNINSDMDDDQDDDNINDNANGDSDDHPTTMDRPEAPNANLDVGSAQTGLVTPQAQRYKNMMLPPTPKLVLLPSPAKPGTTPNPRSLAGHKVIADSDDDGSDSDSSLEDLSTLLFKSASSRPSGSGWEAPSTPTKLGGLFGSTKTISTPQPKSEIPQLDMDALIAEAQKNAKIIEGVRQAAVDAATPAGGLGDAMDVDMDAGGGIGWEESNRILQKYAGVNNLEKARKALERTGTLASGHRQFYFFDASPARTRPQAAVFPSHTAMGSWSVLNGDDASRHDVFRVGLAATIVARGCPLPDELVLWVLDAAYTTGDAATRRAYIGLIPRLPTAQIEALVTVGLVDEMLCGLGAEKQHLDRDEPKPGLQLSQADPNRYANHDFSSLVAWLELVTVLAPCIPHEGAAHTLERLLRMAADSIISSDACIHVAYVHAVDSLCQAIGESQWNDTCAILANSLSPALLRASTRCTILDALPLVAPRAHQLRRRLAFAFFFADPGLAFRHPDDLLTLEPVLRRLHGPEFAISPDTDYVEMHALIVMLDHVMDDGSFTKKDVGGSFSFENAPPSRLFAKPALKSKLHIKTSVPNTPISPTTATPTTPLDDAPYHDPNEKAFNDNIDALSRRLRAIWRSINDTGGAFTARTEAKNTIEWVQQRLSYTVRTRRLPKRDIYHVVPEGSGGGVDDETREEAERQRAYMKRFLRGV